MYYQAQDAAYTNPYFEAPESLGAQHDRRTKAVRVFGVVSVVALMLLAVRATLSTPTTTVIPLESFSSDATPFELDLRSNSLDEDTMFSDDSDVSDLSSAFETDEVDDEVDDEDNEFQAFVAPEGDDVEGAEELDTQVAAQAKHKADKHPQVRHREKAPEKTKIERKQEDKLEEAKRRERNLAERKADRKAEDVKRAKTLEKEREKRLHELKKAADAKDDKEKELSRAEKAEDKQNDQKLPKKASHKQQVNLKEDQKDAQKKRQHKEDQLKKAAQQKQKRKEDVRDVEKKQEHNEEEKKEAERKEKQQQQQISEDKHKARQRLKAEAERQHKKEVKAFAACYQYKCNSAIAALGQGYENPANLDLLTCLGKNTARDAADECWSKHKKDDPAYADAEAARVCMICEHCLPGHVDRSSCDNQIKSWSDVRGNPFAYGTQ